MGHRNFIETKFTSATQPVVLCACRLGNQNTDYQVGLAKQTFARVVRRTSTRCVQQKGHKHFIEPKFISSSPPVILCGRSSGHQTDAPKPDVGSVGASLARSDLSDHASGICVYCDFVVRKGIFKKQTYNCAASRVSISVVITEPPLVEYSLWFTTFQSAAYG
ncbi:unnamed protein product [Schistocephalus solidus]|uniref:Uncharacterized protein n=1 Tax=Schistocephalus solidus TaxID=70667 RepID=A0A183SQB6_SCHSO|nr:unnamed protein product [Schistocephalus solidus]